MADAVGRDAGTGGTPLLEAGALDSGMHALDDACSRAARAHVRDLDELIEHINALPRPLDLPCFIRSLPRPLGVQASTSTFSAQPAGGPEAPRIFLWVGTALVLTIVPSGNTSDLVEFSYLLSNQRSVKGELVFPLLDAVDSLIPADRVQTSGHTVCALCHTNEQPYPDSTLRAATVSGALRPNVLLDTPVSALFDLRRACSVDKTPERCALLSALMDPEELEERPFPEDMPVFF